MQTIHTKYHHPAQVRGSRISATASGTRHARVMCHVADELNMEQNHDAAAIALCQKMRWTGPLFRIDASPHGHVYAFETFRVDFELTPVKPR